MSRHIEAIARATHEANRAWCRANDDYSQPTWEAAPDWQRESAMKGVAFHLANPDADASASHAAWLEEKRRTGWRYGPVKDAVEKTHPCFVPFDKLPPADKAKDHLFRAIIHALAPFPIGDPQHE